MKKGNSSFGFVVFSIIGFVLVMVLNIFISYGNEQEVVATVTDKERVNDSENSYYLVFTDNGVFTIQDQFFHGKFNSSDMYGGLKKDHKYRFVLNGYRIPFLSSYQNVRSFVPAE